MVRLQSVRDGFAADVAKAERDLARSQTKLETARMKLSVADEMIAKVRKNGAKAAGATFAGMGKYSGTPLRDAIVDVINNHAGVDGISAKEISEILTNEGVDKGENLSISIHVTGDRLADEGKIRIQKTEAGKRFFKLVKNEPVAA